MTLQLFNTFAICFMSGALYFANHKISRSTWIWYLVALICSLPSFAKIIQLTQG